MTDFQKFIPFFVLSGMRLKRGFFQHMEIIEASSRIYPHIPFLWSWFSFLFFSKCLYENYPHFRVTAKNSKPKIIPTCHYIFIIDYFFLFFKYLCRAFWLGKLWMIFKCSSISSIGGAEGVSLSIKVYIPHTKRIRIVITRYIINHSLSMQPSAVILLQDFSAFLFWFTNHFGCHLFPLVMVHWRCLLFGWLLKADCAIYTGYS